MKKVINLLVVISLAGLMFSCGNSNDRKLEKKRELLIGNWKLTNYTDNLQRDEQQKMAFEKEVRDSILGRIVILNEDNSYVVSQGAKTQQGRWDITTFNLTLYTMMPNGKEDPMTFGLESVMDGKMILALRDQTAVTFLTFEKQSFK